MKKTICAMLLAAASIGSVYADPVSVASSPTLKAITNNVSIKDTNPVNLLQNTASSLRVVIIVQGIVDPTAFPRQPSDTVTITCNNVPTKVAANGMYACDLQANSPAIMAQIMPENFKNGASLAVSVVER